MANITKVAIFGEGYLADITEALLLYLNPSLTVTKYKARATDHFDIGFICIKNKRHNTGSIDVKDISWLIANNKSLCDGKHFYIRSQLSVGQTSHMTSRHFRNVTVSYFPNFHKTVKDFEKILPVVSRPRGKRSTNHKKNHLAFFGEGKYLEFEHETLELSFQMRFAINAIQAMSFHVLQELCLAHEINFRSAILGTIYAAEKHGEFTIYGADSHSAYGEWLLALKDLARHGKDRNVLGRALLDVVAGLNEEYFAEI